MIYVYAVLAVSIIIFVHELGHLMAARLVSIPIKTFSVGFGPRLVGITCGGIEYRLSLIPLGGYIEPAIATEDELYAFSLWRRVIFTLGGVLANMVFAVFALVAGRMLIQDMPFASAVQTAVANSFNVLLLIVLSIPSFITHSGELAGIIGIVRQGGTFIGSHYLQIFNFAGILSLNLAVINLLPLPVFDGGKVIFYVIEKILPPARKMSAALSIAGWIVILGLTLLATSNDIEKLVT